MKGVQLLILVLIGTLFSVLDLRAQEELGPLWNRTEKGLYLNQEEALPAKRSARADEPVKINYLLNTVDLPVFDDFSKFRVKVLVTDTNDASVFDSTSYRFTVDGSYVDSLPYKTDTVYNYLINPVNNQLDSTMAPTLFVEFFTDSIDPFKKTAEWTVFPSFSTFTQNGQTRIIEYDPDSILENESQKHFFAIDDSVSFWISKGAFFNRTMAKDAPSYGVMTMDGLDASGKPYDNSGRETYGLADTLTSKPINLFKDPRGVRYSSSDSIYLSFFVQAQGWGDQPEERDSLILEFYSPTEGRWIREWSTPGKAGGDFEQVFIHLADTKYLQLGFQFRFKNFATLSGNFDHWHLDYFRLWKDRNKNDTIDDYAIAYPIGSLIKNYSSMPWTHYKSDPGKFMKSEFSVVQRNLSFSTDFGRSRYRVFKNGEVNPIFKTNLTVIEPSVPANTTLPYVHALNSSPNFFVFPSDTNSRQLFDIEAFAAATVEENFLRINDTILHYQLFDRFYSYDDYSAEKTYNLNLVGTSVVIEYNSEIPDTLRAVEINFVETFEPPDIQQINVLVYTDLNEDPIFESGAIDVIYNPAGSFHRYDVGAIPVDGRFYVGYQQLRPEKTFVGYDVNNDSQLKTWVSQIDGSWGNSIFQGTILMRASFGDGTEEPLSNESYDNLHSDIVMYPNPAQDLVYFSEALQSRVQIYTMNGSLVVDEFVEQEPLQVGHLENGFYLVRIGELESRKLIIAR